MMASGVTKSNGSVDELDAFRRSDKEYGEGCTAAGTPA